MFMFLLRPSLVVVHPKQKMNFFGYRILIGYLIDPKIAINQASVFGYRFRIGLQQKKGVHFLMKSPSENGSRICFYTCHGRQQAW